LILIPDKTIESFYRGRVNGPAAKPQGNVVHTFLSAGGAAALCAAMKNFLKLFIKKQYEGFSGLCP